MGWLRLALVLVIGCGPTPRSHGHGDGGDDDNGDGAAMGYCSSDLHDVVDQNGNVIMTCPDDQGCANGQCVPACQAAGASQGTVGCDFVVATPSFYPTITPPCFAVFLANNWPLSASITIEHNGQQYSASAIGRVPNGTPNATGWPAVTGDAVGTDSVAVLFLSSDPNSTNIGNSLACPVAPAVGTTSGTAVYTGQPNATAMGKAWHITTSMPVSGYDILPYGGAGSFLPSAELMLPTTAWGTNYVAASPMTSMGPGWGQITASQDNTNVMISPSVALPGGPGVAAAPPHQTTTYTLGAGDYIQWQNAGDMTGSIINSDKPVSFTGGTAYLCVTSATSTGGGCDSAHQMIPPVSALGFEYVGPPHATRRADLQEESIRYRIVGAVAGTTLTYDPPIGSAPTTLGAGQVAEFETVGPFVVKSQDDMHPFYVGQYMAGCTLTVGSRPAVSPAFANFGTLGDEEYVNILPPAQWLSSYVFFTDPTYATTNLVIVRKKTNGAFQDVNVDCIGNVTGWHPVGGSGDYEITNVDLKRGTQVGSCTDGHHSARSAAPFGVMVWGLDAASSYAYPAGGNVGKINPVVVIF
jgi:hypothetical protein